MSLINQAGFYHGVITDAGLSQSTNGFPQEELALLAAEVYDPDTKTYFPADLEANEITAYLILIDSKDRETKTCQQLKKVTQWDGASFVTLSEMNLIDVPIAFRVEERTYKENTTLQVTWIDTIDASPTRTVQKLDTKDVRALQARYASVLAVTKAPTKAVSAQSVSDKPAVSVPTKPKVQRAPRTSKAPITPVGKCTADEAYNACHKLRRDDVTEDTLNEVWLKTVAVVNVDESKITDEQWFGIKETILKEVSKV